jgi:hypothetical protein
MTQKQKNDKNREQQQTRIEWSTTATVMLTITLLGIVGLIIKYVVLG